MNCPFPRILPATILLGSAFGETEVRDLSRILHKSYGPTLALCCRRYTAVATTPLCRHRRTTTRVNASASPSCHSFLHSAPRRLFCWAHTPLYSTFVHAGEAGQSEPQQNRSDEAESRELQGTGCEYVTALCRASTAMLSWHHCHLSLATTQTPCLTCQPTLLCCLLRAVLLLAVDAGYSCRSAAGHQVRSSARVLFSFRRV